MENAVIVDVVRSPSGRGEPDGALSALDPAELLARVLHGLLTRTGLDPSDVDETVVDSRWATGRTCGELGRAAWSRVAPSAEVPVVGTSTCRSAQHAIHHAVRVVQAGLRELVVVAGVEAGGSPDAPGGPIDAAELVRLPDLAAQALLAEIAATQWKFDRHQLDEYAVGSHQRAGEVAAAGEFADEIVPVAGLRTDETVRPDVTVDTLGTLPPLCQSPELARRFPDVGRRLTTGNSASSADGAGAVIITSERRAGELGLRARARFVAVEDRADHTASAPGALINGTRAVLTHVGLDVDELDHYEIDESFASVPLAWQQEFAADSNRLNPRGGAVALGRPGGAAGIRSLATMLGALEATGGRFGLQAMEGTHGTADVAVVERIARRYR